MSDLDLNAFHDAVLDSFGLASGPRLSGGKPSLRFGPRFGYDGAPFDPGTWLQHVTRQEETPAFTREVLAFRSPDRLLELRLRLTRYRDAPVVEWCPELCAAGDTATAIVSDFLPLALHLPLTPPAGPYRTGRSACAATWGPSVGRTTSRRSPSRCARGSR